MKKYLWYNVIPLIIALILSNVLSLSAKTLKSTSLLRQKRQSGFDDAVVVGSVNVNPAPISGADAANPSSPLVGIGGVTPVDGPAPSLLGSLDNVFQSIKEYDQYQCIERMVCEYMQDDGDSEGELEGVLSFLPQITGPNGIFGGGPSSLFGSGSRPEPGPTRFRPQRPTRFGNRPPPPFRRRLQGGRPRPPPNCGIFCKRRKKRQIHHNVLRLLKVTGLDTLNAFPYVKAALMGHSHRPSTRDRGGNHFRRGSNSCSRLYRDCPTDPERILDYFNNHNGGIINQVQPSVDNEVTPLITKIVNEALENSDLLGTSSSSSAHGNSGDLGLSSLFNTGDQVLTQSLIQGASGYIGDGLKSLAESITGGKRRRR